MDFKQIIESGSDIAKFKCFEWATVDNPYFPRSEIDRLRDTLDPQTFRAMFTINWDVIPKNAVYGEYSEANQIRGYRYNEMLPTYISIDWGWAHPMAVGFFQYDPKRDHVYLFDEIVQSKLKLDPLYDLICAKPYFETTMEDHPRGFPYKHIHDISEWICDIAGDQEREQTGKSNIKHFKDNHNVKFTRRSSRINYGITIVRNYIKTASGKVRFFVDVEKCPKSHDGLKRYAYPEKDGIIQNEVPIKKDDDCADMIRYFFVNKLDHTLKNNKMTQYKVF